MRAVIIIVFFFLKGYFMDWWIYTLLGVVGGFVLTIVIEYFVAKNYFENNGRK